MLDLQVAEVFKTTECKVKKARKLFTIKGTTSRAGFFK